MFFMNELRGGYPDEGDLHLKVEEYGYTGDKITGITICDHIMGKKIAADKYSDGMPGYIGSKDKGKIANTEVCFDKLIYDEQGNVCTIERTCPYNENIGTACIVINNKNDML